MDPRAEWVQTNMAELKADMARCNGSSGLATGPFTSGAANVDTTDPFTTDCASLSAGATKPFKRPLALAIPDHITANLISYSMPISDTMLTTFKTDTSSLWGKQFVGPWPDELTIYVVRGLRCDDDLQVLLQVQFEGMADTLDILELYSNRHSIRFVDNPFTAKAIVIVLLLL